MGQRLRSWSPAKVPRDLLADYMRMVMETRGGIELNAVSDCEILDGIGYFIFPNLELWGGYAYPFHYRVRPNGHDPDSCIWEFMLLARLSDGAELPRDVPLRMTPTEEPWAAANELGTMGSIFDEDMVNLYKIQSGLHSDALSTVTFGNSQERNIRNFHAHLDRLCE